METNNIKIGDKVVLVNYTGSSIGHNGIFCRVEMLNEKLGFFCKSIYGSFYGWCKEENLKKV